MTELSGQQQPVFGAGLEATGELDPRFTLWRNFCARRGIAIDSLPSELCGEAKEEWERLKADQLGGK